MTRATRWTDYYRVGGGGWWYCIACRKRTSEALMTDEWFETRTYVLCPACVFKACRSYAVGVAGRDEPESKP